MFSIMAVDRATGWLIQAVSDAGQSETTFWLITSDHGGHGFGHGNENEEEQPDPLDQTIPFIMSGGLTGEFPDDLTTLDIAPTLAWALGMDVPEVWEWPGRPVLSESNLSP